MINVEELKRSITKIFGEQIIFNKEFDKYISTIKNIDVNLVEWCIKVRDDDITSFRARNIENTFVYIKKIGSSNRCIILKIKNGVFTEIHLGDHGYYDELRKRLGIKQNS